MKTKLMVIVASLALVAATAAQAQVYPSRITSAGSPGDCLGVQETNLGHPIMAVCANYAAESWMVGPANGHGFVKFYSKRTGTGSCLGVAAANTSTVIMANCASVKNQQWMMTPTGQPNTYTLTSQLLGPGVCLGIRPNTGGTELDLNACHNFPGQTWTIGS